MYITILLTETDTPVGYFSDIHRDSLERIPAVTFFARDDTMRRGHSLKIYKEISKREPRRNFFSQRVVIPWNARPEKVVCSNSTLQFKIEYDKFWGV